VRRLKWYRGQSKVELGEEKSSPTLKGYSSLASTKSLHFPEPGLTTFKPPLKGAPHLNHTVHLADAEGQGKLVSHSHMQLTGNRAEPVRKAADRTSMPMAMGKEDVAEAQVPTTAATYTSGAYNVPDPPLPKWKWNRTQSKVPVRHPGAPKTRNNASTNATTYSVTSEHAAAVISKDKSRDQWNRTSAGLQVVLGADKSLCPESTAVSFSKRPSTFIVGASDVNRSEVVAAVFGRGDSAETVVGDFGKHAPATSVASNAFSKPKNPPKASVPDPYRRTKSNVKLTHSDVPLAALYTTAAAVVGPPAGTKGVAQKRFQWDRTKAVVVLTRPDEMPHNSEGTWASSAKLIGSGAATTQAPPPALACDITKSTFQIVDGETDPTKLSRDTAALQHFAPPPKQVYPPQRASFVPNGSKLATSSLVPKKR